MITCALPVLNRKSHIALFYSFLIMAIFLGIRDNIGIDDSMYLRTFNEISIYGYSWRDIEFTYEFFSKIALLFGGSIQFVYLIYSILTSLVFYKILSTYIDIKDWIIVIAIFLSFLFLPFLTLMRQFFAIILLTYSYFLIKNDRKKLALVFYCFSVSMHFTAIIGLPIYLIFPLIQKLSIKFKISSLIILYILQYIPIVNAISNIFIKIGDSLNLYYVKFYLSNISTFYSEPIGMITTIYLILYIVMLVKYKNNSKYNDSISVFTYLFFVFIMGLSQFGYLNRLSYYFSIFTIIMLSRYVYLFKESNRLLIKYFSVIIFLFLFIIAILSFSSLSTNSNPLIPYRYSLDILSN